MKPSTHTLKILLAMAFVVACWGFSPTGIHIGLQAYDPGHLALLRFLIAIISWLCGGLGFWWILWDKQKRSWHDRYSESLVVQLPKKQ